MTETTLLRREDAPLESTWNREVVYPSWADWDADYEQALAELPALRAFVGRLGEGPAVLLDWLQTDGRHGGRRLKLLLFAFMAVAVDTTDQAAKSHLSQATALLGKTAAETAFAEPELLQLGETLLTWADAEPQLAAYKHYFANLIRQQAHQRSAEVEEVLGLLADPFSGVSATYRHLTNSDFRAADAVDSQGRRHPVRNAVPAPTGIQSADREHRRTAWQNFYDGYLASQNSFASNYLTLVKQQVFLVKVRGYDSVLAMMLAPSNLPVAVFHNVVDAFQRHLPIWHRYWAAKRNALGLETLYPYDVFAPLAEQPRASRISKPLIGLMMPYSLWAQPMSPPCDRARWKSVGATTRRPLGNRAGQPRYTLHRRLTICPTMRV
ncbi:MAG: M3 family metallopeptidase [Caldilineaceae bacterium]